MVMTKVASDYAKEFGEKYPDIGELAGGDVLSPVALRALGDLVGQAARRVAHKSLEDKTAPSDMERAFVRSSADMLTRTLDVATERSTGLSGVDGMDKIIQAAWLSGNAMRSPYTGELDKDRPHRMSRVTAIVQDVPGDPESFNTHCTNLTDIIDGSFDALAAVAEQTGGLRVTNYLQGNLQNMIAQFEIVEAASQQP